MDESKLLERITVNPKIFGGKPIIRGRRGSQWSMCLQCLLREILLKGSSKATPGLRRKTSRPASFMLAG